MRIFGRGIKISGVAAGFALAASMPSAAALLPTTDMRMNDMQSTAQKADTLLLAQGSCSAAAAQAARESGGQVLSVSTRQQGGRTVCVVTVLVPARDGDRPRRVTVTIPQ